MTGPADFVQPLYGERPILDGVVLDAAVALRRSPVASAASLLEMFDGSTVIQLDYHGPGEPENAAYYQWEWTQRAADEVVWNLIERVRARGRPVWFVPYDIVMDLFRASAGQTAFSLRRFRAKDKAPSFDDVAFPAKAFRNGTEQTIVATAPTAGQVQIVGKAVTTPSLGAGDELEIRYYPAYPVVLFPLPHDLSSFNALDRTVTAIEAARQEPA